ncbi:response regulator transcription factor [Ktedonobacter racemifer]|uniref:response regulator transcription factor n=1 Tax=Ktedonobacter racemifer TaxID=363277 RepID=UPI001FCB6945|nr:LuxR C-terminal-related transcriptional regulator [Ktedonobacter racemifer]
MLHLLARGASNQDIAEALVTATSTIKHHVSNILSKLEVTNRTQAVARAWALGLLSSDLLD